MDNSIYYRYYQLSIDNIVEPIKCIIADHDLPMHPFAEVIDDGIRMKFECLTCDYKIYPGLNTYEKMRKDVLTNE